MKILQLLFIAILCIFISSCDTEADAITPTFTNGNPDEVEIRIDNRSPFSMKDVEVNTGSNAHTYDLVASSGTSTYQSFFYTYPTLSLSFLVDEKQFEYQDSSYANGNKLVGGKYKLLIYDVDIFYLGFSFRLEKE